MMQLPQGGTAIGTGVNSHKGFAKAFCQTMEKVSGFKVKPASNFLEISKSNLAFLFSEIVFPLFLFFFATVRISTLL